MDVMQNNNLNQLKRYWNEGRINLLKIEFPKKQKFCFVKLELISLIKADFKFSSSLLIIPQILCKINEREFRVRIYNWEVVQKN